MTSTGDESNASSTSEAMDYGGSDAWSHINVLPAQFNQGVTPHIEILEQPLERGHRFRYACEGKSHGVVKGARSIGKNRSFPSIKVQNFIGKAFARISLVTASGDIHDHELTGEKCRNGIYEQPLNVSAAPIQFQELCILHVKKKDADEKRMRMNTYVKPEKGKGKKSDKMAKIVHLKFEVGLEQPNNTLKWLEPVVSGPIYDGKSTDTSVLQINRLSKYESYSTGGEEVFLLCDKVNKDDINVRFYEIDTKGDQVWESQGNFGAADVHHQVAIVFRTPSYFDSNIKTVKNVMVQLYRPSDGQKSDGIPFKYSPPHNADLESVSKKRKKPLPAIANDTTMTIPMPTKPAARRGRKPKSQNAPAVATATTDAFTSASQMAQQMVTTQSVPMTTAAADNDLYPLTAIDIQALANSQLSDIGLLLAEQPPNRAIVSDNMVDSKSLLAAQLDNSQYSASPLNNNQYTASSPNSYYTGSPASNSQYAGSPLDNRPASVGQMTELQAMKMSPDHYSVASPHHVTQVDGEMRVIDETGNPMNFDQFDQFTDVIINEVSGQEINVNDLLNGTSQYQIIAIEGDENTNILLNNSASDYIVNTSTDGTMNGYLATSTSNSVSNYVQSSLNDAINTSSTYSNREANAAAQNIPAMVCRGNAPAQNVPVMVGGDIQTDDVPDSLQYLPAHDIGLPSNRQKTMLHDHKPMKSMQQEEAIRSIYDSGLGSIRSGLVSVGQEQDSVKEEPVDDSPQAPVDVPEVNKPADIDLAKKLENLTVTPQKETTAAAADDSSPTVDVCPPITPSPPDVENRAAANAQTNQGIANPKSADGSKPRRRLIVRCVTPKKCTERDFTDKDCMVVNGVVNDTDMRVAAKMSEGLQCFAQTGDIKYLLALQRHLIDVPDGAGDNALHLAIVHRKLEPLRHLLMINQKIKSSNAVNAYNQDKQTPLHLAVISDEDYMIELLMEYGAKLDLVNATGNTPLHLAARMGSHRCIQSQLTKGEGVHITREFLSTLNFEGLSALHLAVISGNLRCVEHLVHVHADVNQRDGKCGYTPLHHAVEHEHTNIVGYLLMQGNIEPNMPGYNDNTALHLAVSKGNLGVTAALISAGADPEAESAEPLESESEDEDKDKDTSAADDRRADDEREYLTPLDIAQGNSKMTRILKGDSYSSVRHASDSSRASDLASILHSTVISSAETDTVQVLDVVSRMNLSKLLDPPRQDADWIALARLFNLEGLIEVLSRLTSPTSSLIDNLEAMETTVFALKQKLLQLNRLDAVEVLHEALSISERARRDYIRQRESQANSSRR